MNKSKKLLSVFLAVLMIMSFTPLIASAATITVNTTNCTLVEVPKLSYKGGEPTSALVVPGGFASRADIDVIGGKIAYNGTELEGFFSWSSTPDGEPSDTLFSDGEVTVSLYFHPTDTVNYKKAAWRSTATKPIEGWPTITVEKSISEVIKAPNDKTVLLGTKLSDIRLSGGKVINQYGDEITSGTWTFYDDNDTQDASNIYLNTAGTYTYKAVWTAKACETVYADVKITVTDNIGYTVDKPTLPNGVCFLNTGNTFGNVPFVYGESSVPGTYSIKNPNTIMKYNYKYTIEVTFTPDDPTLPEVVWTYTDIKLKTNDEWKIPEDVVVQVPYGSTGDSTSNFSIYWPEEYTAAGMKSIKWDIEVFNVTNYDVGDIVKVDVTAYHTDTRYASVKGQAYIKIVPRVVSGEFGKITFFTSDIITGKQLITFSCDVPGIFGEVKLECGDILIATLKPDENGHIYETVEFQPNADGEYFFTATYVPDEHDRAALETPVVISRTAAIDVKRQVSVYIYNNSKVQRTYDLWSGETVSVRFDAAGYKSEEVEYWEAKNQDGKVITLYDVDGNPVDLTQKTFKFIIPEDINIDEISIYPHGPWDEEIIVDSNDSFGDTIVKLWKKISDWFIEIYRIIVDIFVPYVETL